MENAKGIEPCCTDQKPSKFRKNKIRPLGIAFMLYCLVAAGAFGIEEIIPSAGPGLTLIILIVLPIIWARPLSSMVAEINSFMPAEGGMYVWAKEAFGEFWGFQMGWWLSIEIYIASGAYIALAGGYAAQLLNLDPMMEFVLKAGLIAIFAVINLLGTKIVERVEVVMSVVILTVFAVITIVGFANWQTNPIEPIFADAENPLGCLAAALTIGIWMYCGYDNIASLSGEFEDSNVVTKGLNIVLPLISLSYILPTLACLAALPEGSWINWGIEVGLDAETIGYGTILNDVFGPVGLAVFMISAIVSQCVIFNAYLSAGSRSFWVLAEDKLFPKSFSRIDSKGRSPYIVIITIAISALLFSQLDFTSIIEMNIVFILAPYILLSLILLKFRKTHPVESRPANNYHIRGKVLPIICVVLIIGLSVFTLCLVPLIEYLATLGFLATGLIAYVAFKLAYGGLTKLDPDAHPLDPKTRLARGDTKRIGLFCLIAFSLLLINLILNTLVVL